MSIRVLVRYKGADRNLALYYVDPDTGREVSKSAETKNEREAERAALKWEEELLQHRGADDDGWERFKERFNDEHLAGLPVNSRKSYRTALNHFARLFKVRGLNEISTSTVSIFRSLLLKEKRPVSTVVAYLTRLRAALNWAERVGLMREAPRVEIPKMGKRNLARGRPITFEEFELMLAACKEIDPTNPFQWRRFLELLWFSGLRLNEAMQLSWDSGPVRLAMDAKPYPALIFLEEGHKAREDAAVPLPPDFVVWLKATPEAHRTGLVAPLSCTADQSGRLIGKIGKAAGVTVNERGKAATAHDLRRSFGTRWAMKVRPIVLQRLMRHKTINTTLRYYVGLSAVDIGAELWSTVPTTVPKKRKRAAVG